MTAATPETEMDNVTSSNNVTSRDEEELFAKLVEQAIVRYMLPVVIMIGRTSASSLSSQVVSNQRIVYCTVLLPKRWIITT